MNWQPSASIEMLHKRAELFDTIRTFFKTRNYLEVETPIMGRYGITDLYLKNIPAIFNNRTYFLQTSPEYHMKRLLAAGSGPIFQLARVLRDDEIGRWHNPEFTLLEWYQLDIDHHGMMDEVEIFLQTCLNCEKLERKTYQEIFLEICGVDPLNIDVEGLLAYCHQVNIAYNFSGTESIDFCLFLLMSHIIEPVLANQKSPTAIYNFPLSQAALAQIRDGVAERFEVYYKGIELANGFHELTDPIIQNARFEADLQLRRAQGLLEADVDLYLLAALQHGLPACSGVALGVDRLFALAVNATNIAETLAFDFTRA